MTVYAGETLQVTATPTDFDGAVLSSSDVTSVTITIVDSEDSVVVNNQGMTWDSTDEIWTYDWDTTGLDAGSYDSKVLVTGPGSTVSWEFMTIRLKTNKF